VEVTVTAKLQIIRDSVQSAAGCVVVVVVVVVTVVADDTQDQPLVASLAERHGNLLRRNSLGRNNQGAVSFASMVAQARVSRQI